MENTDTQRIRDGFLKWRKKIYQKQKGETFPYPAPDEIADYWLKVLAEETARAKREEREKWEHSVSRYAESEEQFKKICNHVYAQDLAQKDK